MKNDINVILAILERGAMNDGEYRYAEQVVREMHERLAGLETLSNAILRLMHQGSVDQEDLKDVARVRALLERG